MKYRLVLFDFDGTLADSLPWMLGALNRLADRHRFRRVEEHDLDALRGLPTREVLRALRVPGWKLPRIARDMRRMMAEEIDAIATFPGVDHMLRTLADRGVRLAVVSSNSAANVRRVLGPDIAALVAHYACGASVFGKRAKFRAVLRASGVPAAEALSIGDELRDLQASRAAGLAFGAVAWGFTHADTLRAHDPDHFFTHVDEITPALG